MIGSSTRIVPSPIAGSSVCIQVARKSLSSNINGKAEVHSSADDRTDKTEISFMCDLDDALRKIFEESVTINHNTITLNDIHFLL